MKPAKQIDRFQVSVDYLTEYSGVKGAVITDPEGLVVAVSPQDGVDAELCAAFGLNLVEIMDRNLTKLIDPGCEFLSVKTDKDWITIAQTSVLYLIVVADRKADDLLNVRISRSLDMISSHVKDKYPALLFFDKPAEQKSVKRVEATHV